ncbi:hypothetical protein ES288_D05G434400v1 [Gossypium darwinii]|uniref:RNase H type-1 domain-containing protein n=1 Tax=Gossypium darwinii TaxID=34276 RepID=A0A5D2CQG0_GOSDA|nr:hypothetical protein ES288_D05G434400v1 [Gossypium darwinii]
MIVSHWESPPTEWMKFNVAGVVLEEVAGCGGEGACSINNRIMLDAASEWLSKRYYRPWSLRKLIGDIDCGTKQLAHFQIVIIDRKSNGMVDALAKAGISRSSLFKTSW